MAREIEPGQWKVKWQGGDKFLMINKKGETREAVRDREGIKRGDYLQPHTDKGKFIETYGYHPQESRRAVEKFLKRKGLAKKQYANFEPNKRDD